MNVLDRFVLAILTPLAIAILISGLDDLIVDLAWAWTWIKSVFRPAASLFPPGPRQLENAPRQRIAIFVPLWHEHEVIGQMLEHNLAAIRYPDYHFFAGCYPNDALTQEAVQTVAARFPKVHLAVCPHPGPTSKADCLNWVYQHLLLEEERSGQRFDIVLIHDAEDLIHPEELSWINYYAARYDFVQTPVLALPTPLHWLTHGVYCDEFAENHTRDMLVRESLGGFVPSAGVGTGYRREALEKLAHASSNQLFSPEALTEDYENGLRMFRLGCSQAFVPISHGPGRDNDFVATRELHAVAGVGHPEAFFAGLRAAGLAPATQALADHRSLEPERLPFPAGATVLMTEKDAVKCAHFAQPRWWWVELQVQVDRDDATLLLGCVLERTGLTGAGAGLG